MSNNKTAVLMMDLINLQSFIQKRIGRALAAHGIGISEYLVLNQLFFAKDQRMRRKDLAENVGLTPSGVTRLLLPMEKIGLVEREKNPRDARVSLVSLAKGGKQIFEDAQISFETASEIFFEELDLDQIDGFSAVIDKISN